MSDSATLRTPLHALHVELGARMGPFAGYDMPIQFASGILAEHLHTRAARRPVRRLAYGPGDSSGPITRPSPPRSSDLCPADILGLAPGRQRYTPAAQRRRRNHRRPDGLAAAGRRRPAHPRRQRRAQRRRFRAARSAACRRSVRLTRLDDLRAHRAAGPGRGRRPRAARAGQRPRGDAVHVGAAGFASAGVDRLRLALRLHRRGRVRDLAARRRGGSASRGGCSPSRKSRRSASARAIRCGSKRACASTATSSTRRSIRSRPGSPGRSRSGGASRAAFPARRASRRRSPTGPARKRVGLRPEGRAPAREGAEIVDASGAEIGRVTSGGFGP